MVNSKSQLFKKPTTRLGWWAIGLGIAFIVMMILNSFGFMYLPVEIPWRRMFLPSFGVIMMACGVAAFITGLIAIIAKHERSWAVWLALIPGAFALFFIVGEFLFPH
ncbi:MAG: hypothetical protein MUO40_12540 [Anaerolineaceae bacterium]|nr:hypothetical protein [Anaerolineaceae bacterium]